MSNATTTKWAEVRLENVAEKVAMGPFGSNIKVETFAKEGIPVISGAHLRGVKLEDTDYNFISVEHADRLASANVKRGDVVFTHAGNIGQVSYIPQDSKYDRYIVSQRQFYLRPNPKLLSAEYLTYYFWSSEGHHQLMTYANQVGVPSIAQPVTNLKRTEILLPPIEEQKRIVNVLLSLDNKIGLLQKQNETLEQIAQAIFAKWFTESNGNKVPLNEVVEVNPTTILKKGIAAPYLGMAALPTKGSWCEKPIMRVFSSGSKFKNGDTLLARITPCLENGKTAYVQNLQDGEVGWGSTEFIVLRPKPPLPPEYAYLLARNDTFRDFAIRIMSGTSGRQRVQTDMLASYEVVIPSDKVIADFREVVSKLFAKIKNNSMQIEELLADRDLLLPKLVNGDIRVSN